MDQAQEPVAGAPCDLPRLTTLAIGHACGLEDSISHFQSLRSLRNLGLCWDFRQPLLDGMNEGYLNMLRQEDVRLDSLMLRFAIPSQRNVKEAVIKIAGEMILFIRKQVGVG